MLYHLLPQTLQQCWKRNHDEPRQTWRFISSHILNAHNTSSFSMSLSINDLFAKSREEKCNLSTLGHYVSWFLVKDPIEMNNMILYLTFLRINHSIHLWSPNVIYLHMSNLPTHENFGIIFTFLQLHSHDFGNIKLVDKISIEKIFSFSFFLLMSCSSSCTFFHESKEWRVRPSVKDPLLVCVTFQKNASVSLLLLLLLLFFWWDICSQFRNW